MIFAVIYHYVLRFAETYFIYLFIYLFFVLCTTHSSVAALRTRNVYPGSGFFFHHRSSKKKKRNKSTGGFFRSFCMCFIQHYIICRPSDSSVLDDAGIEPRTVSTLALPVRCSNHSACCYKFHQVKIYSVFKQVLSYRKRCESIDKEFQCF